MQTVKQQRGKSAGLFIRDEWQCEVDGREPDLAAARDTLRARFAAKLKRLQGALGDLSNRLWHRAQPPVGAVDAAALGRLLPPDVWLDAKRHASPPP